MSKSEKELTFLSTLVGEIRKEKTLTGLLDKLMNKTIDFFKAQSGFIMIVDSEKKTIKFKLNKLDFKIDKAHYRHHPMEEIPKMCSLLNGRDDSIIYNNLIEETKGKKNIYKLYFSQIPKSVIAKPIFDTENNLMGAISIISNKQNGFSDNDLLLLRNIAEQTSATIEKLLLIDQLDKITKISKILFHDFSYESLVLELVNLFDAYGCSIFLKSIQGDKTVYVVKETTGIENVTGNDYDNTFYEIGEGLTGYVAKTGACLRIYDTKNRQEISEKAPGLIREGPKYKTISSFDLNSPDSFLACPFNSGGDVLGVIRLSKHESANYFTPYDENTLKLISDYITARIRLEKHVAEVESVKEIEFLNQQLRDFGHDARHSHGTLSGYLNTLYGWIPKTLRDEQATQDLLIETKRSNELTKLYVNKIATFSKVDSKVKVYYKKVNLRELIKNIVSMLSRRLKKCRITPLLSIPIDLRLDADPEKLEQVFINLINNSMTAISRSGKPGTIEIDGDILMIDRVSFVNIEVIDSGPGIIENYKERIFDRYFSGTGGTGIGLAIAKSVIEAHKGKIFVGISKQDHGTSGAVICIQLPLVEIKERGK